MQAIRMHRHGGPDVLVLEELPLPEPGPGELRIRVASAAVNYADLMRRRDDPYPFATVPPFVPGGEVAGTVDALGPGVDGPPVGTPVFALAGVDGSGGYAQFAVADARRTIPIPPVLSEDEAASLIVAGGTALIVLDQVARLQPGEAVLIPAAAGGVGSFAVQVARVLGAGTILAGASTEAKRDWALGLGAHHAVDTSSPGWPEVVRALTAGRGVDVALEMTGGDELARTFTTLAPFARMVVYGLAGRRTAGLDAETARTWLYAPALNQTVTGFNVGAYFGLAPERAAVALGRLVELVASGEVRVPVTATLDLARAADAHRLIESRQATGKVVLKPWP